MTKMSFKIYSYLKETGEGLVKLPFKLGYVEKQFFKTVSVNSYKNGSLVGDA